MELDRLVETQPDPVKDGVVRWRCCDLKIQIKNRFDVEISERSVGRILRARKFRRLAPRPKHAKADEAVQQTSAIIFLPSYGNICRSTPRPSPSKSGFWWLPHSQLEQQVWATSCHFATCIVMSPPTTAEFPTNRAQQAAFAKVLLSFTRQVPSLPNLYPGGGVRVPEPDGANA